MSVRPSTPGLVCLQCGDVGFSNAFVYCVKCLKFAVHRYCLNVIPKLNEFVRWICDDCEAEEKNQHHVLKNVAIRHKRSDCTTSEYTQGDSRSGMKKNGVGALRVEEPAPQTYDPCAVISLVEHSEPDSDLPSVGLGIIDEATVLSPADESETHGQSSSQLQEEEKVEENLIFSKLSADTSQRDNMSAVSVMRKDQLRHCINSADRPHKECTDIGFDKGAKLASDSTVPKEMKAVKASLKRDEGLHNMSDPEIAAAPPPFSSFSGSLGSSGKVKLNMPSAVNLKDHRLKPLSAQQVKKPKGFDLGTPYVDMTTRRRSVNPSGESGVTKDRRSHASNHTYSCDRFPEDSTISPTVDSSIRSEPVMEPIWRGNFSISNNKDGILEDIMAHLSIQACQKVYDEARQFVPLLHLEMLPRSHVWPQSFGTSESAAENIALYFFPSDRSERFYEDLVDEMMEEELALKATVKNAELLVFPSTKLPLSHWRFRGKYYMWGVFRAASRYKPVMRGDDKGSVGAMKNLGRESPLSPLSNCSSYGSRTC